MNKAHSTPAIKAGIPSGGERAYVPARGTVASMLSFEDFRPGEVHDLGTLAVDEAAIIAFATTYDPQPMHTDPIAARLGAFGGLIACGWHTSALMCRLLSQWRRRENVRTAGQPAIDSLRWLRPVRPDDVLSGRLEVLETGPSDDPALGVCRHRVELIDQTGNVLTRLEGPFLHYRREVAG